MLIVLEWQVSTLSIDVLMVLDWQLSTHCQTHIVREYVFDMLIHQEEEDHRNQKTKMNKIFL